MAFKKNKLKAPKMAKKTNIGKNVIFYGIIAALLAVSFIGLQRETAKYKREISVVSMKEEIGGKVIETGDIEPYKLPEKAVKEGMIKWDDREEQVVGRYLSMQVRPETPLFGDMISENSPIRYQYLYELAPNEELLTFTYSNIEAGGRIPRPGDRFRIRGSYTVEDSQDTSGDIVSSSSEDVRDEDGNVIIAGSKERSKITNGIKTDIVFDVVTVVDMLNGKGDSISEVIKEFNSLSAVKQEELMADDSFKNEVTPASLLLVVKSEQVQKYVEFNAGSDVKYTLTLLTRDKSLMEDDIRTGGSILDSIAPTDGGDSN